MVIVTCAIGVSHIACKDEFRRNLRSHSWSVFSFFIIYQILTPPIGRRGIGVSEGNTYRIAAVRRFKEIVLVLRTYSANLQCYRRELLTARCLFTQQPLVLVRSVSYSIEREVYEVGPWHRPPQDFL